MSDSAVLTVLDAQRSFGGIRALNSCSLSVEPESITALIGPNGCGKTTLLNCISGVLSLHGGDIALHGKSVRGWSSHRIARAGIGRTFQTTRIFPELSIRENIEVAAMLAHHPDKRAAVGLLEEFDLQRFLDRPAGTVSYGQQKLVELAALVASGPKVILLDEPAAGINPSFVDIMGGLIKRLREGGCSFLVVEHNMPFVLGLADSVVVMATGSVIAAGTPDAIKGDPKVLEAYLGEAHDDA